MLNTLLLLAQQGGEPKGGGPPPGFEILILALPLLLLFWLIVVRPGQRRQQQERDALVSGLKKNDKVLTTAGIYGTVVSVSDKEDEVVVKVDDNTRLKMLKNSIMRNLTNEEAARAAKEAKDNPKKEGAA
jgi:preprotein translocase subunit YajC